MRVQDVRAARGGAEARQPHATWLRPVPLSGATRSHNLPVQLSSFVGRDRDLAEVQRSIGDRRLVTLTGFGGVGKTRLALEVAGSLLDRYLDGVRLVELAALVDPLLVPHAVASALDLAEQPGRSIDDVLVAALRTQEMLLVLDNCEHLLDASAALVERVLRTCPDVRIIATGREALGIGGEVVWPVAPLELPAEAIAVDRADRYGALRLFLERCRVRKPDFASTEQNLPATIEICRRLDGIPLAIELAAAWIPSLSVDELATRLDDRFRLFTGGSRTALPRHQTLRALVDWSYDRLLAEEQTVLRELTVFAGGWTLAAAEAVCTGASGGDRGASPIELLGRLVAKSLVVADDRAGATRYSFLVTIRQYGAEKLDEAEGDAARRRHAAYFLDLAERAEPELRGADQRAALARLTDEQDNLRAALRWSISSSETETALRLCGALWRFWWIRADLDEGPRWLRQALAMDGDASPTSRAHVLNGAGALSRLRGEVPQATAYHAEALALLQEIGFQQGIAATYQNLASVAKDRAAFDEAQRLYLQSLALFREIGDEWGIAMALNNLGINVRGLRQYDRARALCEEALAIRRARGDVWGVAMSLNELARIARARGEYDRAGELCNESLTIFQALGVKLHIAASLEVAAWVAGGRGEHTRAARLFGAADALRSAIGAPIPPHERAGLDAAVSASRTGLGPARFAAAFGEGRALATDDAVQLAVSGEASVKAETSGPALSRREREVVVLLARGLSNRELAEALVVSQLTAASHVRNILRKLGLDRRGQVAAWAARNGITA